MWYSAMLRYHGRLGWFTLKIIMHIIILESFLFWTLFLDGHHENLMCLVLVHCVVSVMCVASNAS